VFVQCISRVRPSFVFRFLNIFASLCGAVATAGAFARGATAPALSPAIEQAAKTFVTRNALEASIRFLASDSLEGRGPGISMA